MIDMVFLLLVFFMTVSTLARNARPEMDLALSSTAKIPPEAPPRAVLSAMQNAGSHRYYWYKETVDQEELRVLEVIRDTLLLSRLHSGAIEWSARARHMTL